MTDNGMLDSRLRGNDNAGGVTMRLSVIPAEAGIQAFLRWRRFVPETLDPVS